MMVIDSVTIQVPSHGPGTQPDARAGRPGPRPGLLLVGRYAIRNETSIGHEVIMGSYKMYNFKFETPSIQKTLKLPTRTLRESPRDDREFKFTNTAYFKSSEASH